MSRLIYIHDTLYFDNKSVNELNATERGELATYVNNLPDDPEPDSVDRDDVDDIAQRLHRLADELENL